MKNLCLVLTATVDPGATPFTARANPVERANDYATALRIWTRQPSIKRIVMCENSGYDLSKFDMAIARRPDLTVELLAAPVQSHPPERGKGFGEMAMLEYVASASRVFAESRGMVKVTGRYTVRNWSKVIAEVEASANADIICNLAKNLRWADSRVYYATHSFSEKYLLPRLTMINDSQGVYFEHVLARAVHALLADGREWRMWPVLPDIAGTSGTANRQLDASLGRSTAREVLHRLKRLAIEK